MNKMIRLTKKLHKGLNDKNYVNNADNEDDIYQKLGEMYKGMNVGETYTLKELGLFEKEVLKK